MKLLASVLSIWCCLSVAGFADSPLEPLQPELRQQVYPQAKEIRIPLSGTFDPASTGMALLSVKNGTNALPLEGWQHCIATPDANLPFHALALTWPETVAAGDLDLTFAIWQQPGAGQGTCAQPANGRPPDCATAGCVTETFQIARASSRPLLHLSEPLTRILIFEPSGALVPLKIPVIPASWVTKDTSLRLRILDESHDSVPGPPRFDLCIDVAEGVPNGLIIKGVDQIIPVGTTTLKAHLWADQGGAGASCASTDTGAAPAYDPAACTKDKGIGSAACQPITLKLTRSQATLRNPGEASYVEATVFPFLGRFGALRDSDASLGMRELILAEPQNTVQLDGALRAPLKTTSGGVTDGSVWLTSKGGNALNGATSTAFNIHLDPPGSYGSFAAEIALTGTAGTMQTVTLPINVLLKMPWYALALVIALGVLLGYIMRCLFENTIPMLEARSKARTLIDTLVRQAHMTEDPALRETLQNQGFALTSAYHEADMTHTTLEERVSATKQAVEAALKAHGAQLESQREVLSGWKAALRLRQDLPHPMNEKHKSIMQSLDDAKEALDQENATAALQAMNRASDARFCVCYSLPKLAGAADHPMPALAEELGSYHRNDDPAKLVSAAKSAAETVVTDDPSSFGPMLQKIPAVAAALEQVKRPPQIWSTISTR